MQQRLTDRLVERLKPGPGSIKVWDVEVKGFALRIFPSGPKSFVFQFGRGKVKVQATIGSAACWTCADARERARELRKLHEDGRDARATLVEERSRKDLADLVNCWREDYKPKIRPHSQATFESLLKKILPEFGNRLVGDLSLADVERRHRKIAKEGHVVTANRAVTFLRRLLSIAEKKGWRPMGCNPVTHFERPSEESRARILSADELKALGATLRAFPVGKKDPDPIRFLALSGLRKAEALELRWEDIDLARGPIAAAMEGQHPKLGEKVKPKEMDPRGDHLDVAR